MTLRRLYERLTRRKNPLGLDRIAAEDALALLLPSREAARPIVEYIASRPGAFDLPADQLAAELAALPGVGPASAAAFVAVEVYAARRLELPEARSSAPERN